MDAERQHIVKSAAYWFNGARRAQEEGKMAEALMCMENAYNHVENALAAREVGSGRLIEVLKHARACFANLQPDFGGPISAQMGQMVKEINETLQRPAALHVWRPIGGEDGPVGFHCDHCDRDLLVQALVGSVRTDGEEVPCPFCGKQPKVTKYPLAGAHPSHDLIRCETVRCPASHRASDREAWERRAYRLPERDLLGEVSKEGEE